MLDPRFAGNRKVRRSVPLDGLAQLSEQAVILGVVTRRAQRHKRLSAEIALAGETTLAEVEGSPGPTWGFNGVDTLSVTDRALWIASSRLPLFGAEATRVRRLFLEGIEDFRQARRRAFATGHPDVLVLQFRSGGRTYKYAFKDASAASVLATTLSR